MVLTVGRAVLSPRDIWATSGDIFDCYLRVLLLACNGSSPREASYSARDSTPPDKASSRPQRQDHPLEPTISLAPATLQRLTSTCLHRDRELTPSHQILFCPWAALPRGNSSLLKERVLSVCLLSVALNFGPCNHLETFSVRMTL